VYRRTGEYRHQRPIRQVLHARRPRRRAAAATGKADPKHRLFSQQSQKHSRLLREAGEEHGGQVPAELDKLVKLPGVGRKTANVVLGTAFGIASGVVVDTHVTRLSNRLGLTEHEDAVKIERDLIEQLPSEEWIDFSHRLIWHGRRVCKARKPLCGSCVLEKICPKVGVE